MGYENSLAARVMTGIAAVCNPRAVQHRESQMTRQAIVLSVSLPLDVPEYDVPGGKRTATRITPQNKCPLGKPGGVHFLDCSVTAESVRQARDSATALEG